MEELRNFERSVAGDAGLSVPTTKQSTSLKRQRGLLVGVVVRSFTDGNGYLRTSWLVCRDPFAGNKTERPHSQNLSTARKKSQKLSLATLAPPRAQQMRQHAVRALCAAPPINPAFKPVDQTGGMIVG